MVNIIASFLMLFLSNLIFAKTPSIVISGAAANNWTQAGVRVSDKPFDLAIQGNGFFVIQLESGEQVYSRYGEMGQTEDGFLIQSFSRGKILGNCGGEFQPINLSEFARDEKGNVAKSFRVELDGKITAIYESGYTRQTCTVALALFNNPTKLHRDKHILSVTAESGSAFIGTPQSEGRGSIYGSSLEELDEQMYRLNIKSAATERVIVEMEKERLAKEDWRMQKTLFYVYELNVSRQELSEIEKSLEQCSSIIKNVVSIAESGTGKVSDEDFSSRIQASLNRHYAEVLNVLGQERFDRAKKFRDKYNEQVWEKFGTSLRFTGF